MSTVLTFQNEQVYHRHLLPAMNNADYYYTLVGKKFCLEESLELHLEIINKVWRICPDTSCRMEIIEDGARRPVSGTCPLTDGVRMELISSDGERILLETEERDVLRPYRKYLLPPSGEVKIGTGGECGIRLADGTKSTGRAQIYQTGEEAYIENLSEAGVFHNSLAVRGCARLAWGDVIDMPPLSLVWLNGVLALDCDAPVETDLEEQAPAGDSSDDAEEKYAASLKRELYRRPPRKLETLDCGVVEIEAPPDPFLMKKQSFTQLIGNSVLMVVPMLMGSLMMIIASRQEGGMASLFMYSGLVMALSSMLVGIIWALISARSAAAEQKASENHRFEAYSSYLIGKSDEIRKHYQTNKERLKMLYPPAESCLSETRLWNRNSRQDDFLKVRVGTGDIPFQMEIHIPQEHFSLTDDSLRTKPEWIRDNFKTLYDVPVLFDLKRHPLTGFVGGEEKFGAFALMRVVALQLAATHCYTDVKMVFIYDSRTEEEEWEFARWLPHVWSENRQIRYTAGTFSEISDVCYELTRIFHERLDSRKELRQDPDEEQLPHFVMFLSDPKLIEGELISAYVYRYAQHVGLSTVILSDYRETLPNECEYYLYANERFEGIVDSGTRQELKYDSISESELSDFAHRISGVRVKENSSGGEIPASVTFLEMYGVNAVDELGVKDRWLKNRTYDNIRGLLGEKGGSEPLGLDLHEKFHGPHGLVAGTTGSGKSESLQTFLLSLAVEYSPDDIAFFVIDYKGGGMANLFEGLPHLTGSISNLSGAQINRALVSIKSENRRRQMMFNAAHVNNINRYTRLYKEGVVKEPIPHLLIVIDEFAELKKEEPDFMRELISVAQVGRSLGVHLILATQKPAGTVDDNIWSNSNFRLCLRVQTKEDSIDMLGNPDAAFITQAGRGYLQVGNQELYEMFQSGYSGAPYEPDRGTDNEATAILTLTGRTDAGYEGHKRKAGVSKECSQLDAVKDYLADIAVSEGYTGGHQLWMPLLRNPVYLEEFEEYTSYASGENGWKEEAVNADLWDLRTVIGQTDDPENQSQKPLFFSLSQGGHHAVIGSVVSGKSILLETIIYSLVTTYSPKYLNVYAIDYSSRLMGAFEGLAHVGGVMYDGDEEKTARFFHMLHGILEERKKKYRGGNYAQYVKAHGVEDPAVILVIDNFGAFNEKTQEQYLPRLITLSKEGVSNGIFLLISGGGFGMNEIPNRLGENMGTVLTLALPDKFAYADALRMTRVGIMPDTAFKGRGLCRVDGQVLEWQAALALEADDDFQRTERIRERCAALNAFCGRLAARRVPEIPENPTMELFTALPDTCAALRDDLLLPAGYRMDNAEVYSLDFGEIYCCLVSGLRRTGKSSMLRLMIREAMMKESASVVLIDGGGKLKDLHALSGLKAITGHEALFDYCMNDLTPAFRERNDKKHELLDLGLEGREYYEAMAEYPPVFVFITDLVSFIREVYADEHEMKGFMETLFQKGEGHKISFIAALSLENRAEAAGYEAFNLFTQYRTGIHMGGNVSQDPYLSFESVGFREQSKAEPPGIAYVPEMGRLDHAFRIVVPYAGKRSRTEK